MLSFAPTRSLRPATRLRFVPVLDHGRLAVGDLESEADAVAFRDASTARDDDGELAPGLRGGLHACAKQRRLNPTFAELCQRPRAEQGKDAVFGNYAAGSRGDDLPVGRSQKRQGLRDLEQRGEHFGEAFRRAALLEETTSA